MASDVPLTLPLMRKLASIYQLSEDEKKAIYDLPVHVRIVAAGEEIVVQGDRPSHCCLLLNGFACRHKTVGDGGRQIVSFHIPGEMPDLMSLHLPVMDHDLSASSQGSIGMISHHSVRRLIQKHPRVGDALWRDTLIDAAIFREWMVGLGRRDARSRIAHLLCELVVRMEAVGLAQGKTVRLPMTQSVIADATGITVVHVNRVLQELRANGLIAFRSGDLDAKDWNGLKQVAGFDPTYLHLGQEKRAAVDDSTSGRG